MLKYYLTVEKEDEVLLEITAPTFDILCEKVGAWERANPQACDECGSYSEDSSQHARSCSSYQDYQADNQD